MKKILIILCCLLISFNVYGANNKENYKEFNYEVVIDGEKYSASVKYFDENIDPDERFVIDYDSMTLKDSNNKIYTSNQMDTVTNAWFCTDYADSEFCDKKDGFSYDEINNSEYMKNYLPKFIKFNGNFYGDGKSEFLWYSVNEENMTYDEKNDLYDIVKKYTNVSDISFQDSLEVNISSDIEYEKDWIDDNYGVSDWSSDIYINNALILKDLIDEANDVKVCNEKDLNKIRTLRNIKLLDLKDADVSLSSSCYNILFGDGLGQGSLYSNVIKGYNYINDDSNTINEKNHYTMSYLFYKSEYLIGVSILSGNEMRQEIAPVARCTMLGEKTTEIIQYGFNAFKMIGLVLGCLLCVVDIFKIVVQKDDSGKKQLSIMLKRIIGIVALILTPILVEIIFEFINTIGVSDPICGIR